ncbi:MAG: Gfo/Idh/MocA family oxidoreductase [Kiritimatiellaeota bacterium]|nr:Gfo/Idh/MocA family oxidoreductase [Kiritimatiellota bacterium]
MNPVKLAMVGCGKMGQAVHLRNFIRVKNCTVVAVCDQQSDLAREVAVLHHIPQHFGSVDELTRGAEFDAVAIVVPPQLHPPLATALLEAGKHVYIEKPIALNSGDARRIADCAKANSVRLMVAYMKRYDPGCQRAKAVVESALSTGEMGKVVYARLHNFEGEWRCGYDPPVIEPMGEVRPPDTEAALPDFIEESEKNFYSYCLDNFCHDVNLMRYLLGDPVGVRYSNWRGGAGSVATVVAMFDYGSFECALEWGSFGGTRFEEAIRINFEKGWIRLDVNAPLRVQAPATVTICRKGDIQELAPEWGWSFRREAEHFIDCILRDREPLSSGEDCVTDLVLAEEMYRRYRRML